MEQSCEPSPSAYEYPLLVKRILETPIAFDPDREIVYKGSLTLTYRQFHERVARLASALVTLGITQGDTVAVMDWDSHRYLECYFAIPMIGAVLHTVNIRLSPEQLIYTMEHAEDKLVLVNADFIPLIEAIKGRIDSVKDFVLLTDGDVSVKGNLNLVGEYEALLARSEPMKEYPEFPETTRATTFYTTGTTGLPKGVHFSHRQLVLHTLAVTATLSSITGGPGFNCGDVYMPITPMFHVHAWGIPYIATFLGVKQVYPGKYAPASLIALVKSERVTFSHCVPTILAMLLSDPTAQGLDWDGWKVIIGGSALPKALCAQALSRGINIFAGYGMSETCPVVSLTRITEKELALDRESEIAARTRTGDAVALADIRVIDANGAEVKNDDRSAGEIVIRAPWLTQSYFKDRSNSERLWEGGWLHTQDVATRNSARSLRITDRLKDVIKVGGEWLSSLEIEDILSSHPAIAECAVISRADEKWGELPLACVVKKTGGTETSEHRIVEHVKGYIDRGMIPREAILLKIRFVDALDKTSVGKIDKKTLREKYSKA